MSQEITNLIKTSGDDSPEANAVKALDKVQEGEFVGKNIVEDEKQSEKIQEERNEIAKKKEQNEEIQNAKVNPLDKPETEDTSWYGGVKKWYDTKMEENRIKNKDFNERMLENKKKIQKTLTGKIIAGLCFRFSYGGFI